MIKDKGSLLNLVNGQGFLFQLRIEHEIKTTQDQYPWRILAREHRWIDAENGEEGFIDLVLGHGNLRIVVECKRVQNATWVFLAPHEDITEVNRLRLLWTYRRHGKENFVDWDDFRFRPKAAQSSFCIVEGQDKDKPMLERVSGMVLQSLENLAEEELKLFKETEKDGPKVYIPVIVTTATLGICRFNPSEIDIQEGKLFATGVPGDLIETVPFIIFRKGMESKFSPHRAEDLEAANKESERSVVIVTSTQFSKFLTEFTVDYAGSWPWISVVEQAELAEKYQDG